MRDITGSADVNIWGSCSGGITMSAFLANLARGRKQGSQRHRGGLRARHGGGAEHDGRNVRHPGIDRRGEERLTARRRGRGAGTGAHVRLDAPNDLIWNYWVNNYLLGNAPPAFDVLYWNNDTTRLPARLHADFLDLIDANPYVIAGRLKVRGTPLDMRRLNLDSYVVAGLTDHITPWQGCYNTAKLYGERSTFVLANSGHIQSLLNPPGNPKACFWTGAASEEAPRRGSSAASTAAAGGRTGSMDQGPLG